MNPGLFERQPSVCFDRHHLLIIAPRLAVLAIITLGLLLQVKIRGTSIGFAQSAPGGSIAFVQANYAVPQTPQTTVTVTYTNAQTAGNLNVVVAGWNDSTAKIGSVTDSQGNAYVLAVGPTVQSGTATQAIYYAKNIAAAGANGNTVTVTFNTGAVYLDIRIAEYSGIDHRWRWTW